MALVHGEDGAPLVPHVPREEPVEEMEFEYDIETAEPLLFVVKMLARRMAARLAARSLGAGRIILRARVPQARAAGESSDSLTERARVPQARAAGESSCFPTLLALDLPHPLTKEEELFAILRAHVDRLQPPAPLRAISLSVARLAPRMPKELDLFQPEARADKNLPSIALELSAELGADRVGHIALCNHWEYERRTVLVPYGKKAAREAWHVALVLESPEPLRYMRTPLVRRWSRSLGHLTRLEGVGFWNEGMKRRDFLAVWIPDEEAIACAQVDERAVGTVVGWME